jgi:hypothetical protein
MWQCREVASCHPFLAAQELLQDAATRDTAFPRYSPTTSPDIVSSTFDSSTHRTPANYSLYALHGTITYLSAETLSASPYLTSVIAAIAGQGVPTQTGYRNGLT